MPTLTIGSRRSLLAQTQTNLVRNMLRAAWPELEVAIHLMDTQGDLNRDVPLPAIGGKGLFTLELEQALRDGRIDLAVHSLKDLPVEDSPGLTVVAIPERATPGDMLISRRATSLDALPPAAIIGTSSLRRAAQALAHRPDLEIKDIRGNVDTRLRKLDDPALGYQAILLAQAGLARLNYALDYAYPVPYEVMLPAPGQGALGVQGRADDAEINRYVQPLEHHDTRLAVTAERAFLNGLGGGCSLPVGALATVTADRLELQALVAHPDGQQLIRLTDTASLDKPFATALETVQRLGHQLAQQALTQGAANMLP